MDVNNSGQNIVNLNVYNSNLSNYAEPDTQVNVQPVKNIQEVKLMEDKPSEENDPQKQEYNKKDLDNALKKINNFMKDEHTHAEYAFHKDFSNTLMIKIVDDDTKKVILEIPPEKILDMVASMCKRCGLLDRKA